MTTKSSSSEFLNKNTPIKNSNSSSSSSRYLPTVCLEDWWLLRSEDGKRLCIGGLVLTENRAKRVFSSAPITKRYSLRSLKTADGFEILIQGAFNNCRTQENGFSSEVCNIDSVKEIMSSSNGRRAPSRIKILGNNLKDDQPTNNKIQGEREKVHSVSVGSDCTKSRKLSFTAGGRKLRDWLT
ncbi:hypothetical protein MKX01_042252, partial [Papaver californicum]